MARKPTAKTYNTVQLLKDRKEWKTGGLLHSGKTINTAEGEKWEGGESAWQGSGTSIFDPVLCELSYRWFCPPGGTILDPFAGGSVRGIVAAKLGRRYLGVDLSGNQIAANRMQAQTICEGDQFQPTWKHGTSEQIEALYVGEKVDMIFSCPPYFDLEVYSTDKRDLSAMTYEQFRVAYSNIITACVRMLKNNRFAVFVVGDLRDKDGFYRNFPGHTIDAFIAAGMKLYNECILVTAVGSLPIRITKQFNASRKLGKTHQNVYVFCKGDPRTATQAIGSQDDA